MKTKLIPLLGLLLAASFSYAQSVDLTSGVSVDTDYTDFSSASATASGVTFSGNDQQTLSVLFDAAQDLTGWENYSLTINGSMSSAPSTLFGIVFYDDNFNTAEFESAAFSDLASGSATATFATDGGLDWSAVTAFDLVTGGGGDSTAGTLTSFSSVPEPSTYALIAGFAAFVFVAIRRRK